MRAGESISDETNGECDPRDVENETQRRQIRALEGIIEQFIEILDPYFNIVPQSLKRRMKEHVPHILEELMLE